MSLDDATTSRMFAMATRIAELEDKVGQLTTYYMQTMLTIATMAGGEIRIGELDTRATIGRTLATFVDPTTGERVFVAKTSECEVDHAHVDD